MASEKLVFDQLNRALRETLAVVRCEQEETKSMCDVKKERERAIDLEKKREERVENK